MTLEPDRTGATRLTLRSEQEPASRWRGLIRLFGRREVATKLDASLDRLAALFATASSAAPA